MSANGKANDVYGHVSEPDAGNAPQPGPGRAQEVVTSCTEVPVRALGHAALNENERDGRRSERFEEDTTTVVLLPRGAVIVLAAVVARGQELMLVHGRTNRYAHCRVINIRVTGGVRLVELEFTHSIPDFWGVMLPGSPARPLSGISSIAIPVQQQATAAATERSEKFACLPGKAMAATAAAGAETRAPMACATAAESPAASAACCPSPAEETAERPAAPEFFTVRPMECIPVGEPVMEPGEQPAASGMELEPTAQMVKWEPLSTPEPESKRSRLPAVLGLAVCAALLGYHFYAPAEAALSIDPPSVDASNEGSSQTAGATSARQEAGGGERASSVVVVSDTVPEVGNVEAPKQKVVLVSGLTMPVQNAAKHPEEAPELSSTAGDAANMAGPDKTPGFLVRTSTAPPPPPEPAPVAAEPVAEPLTPARLVSSTQPAYPPAAKQAQIQGDVVIETAIDASGKVTGMKVLSGSALLRTAATTALANWKFEPALRGERPEASTSIVTIHFRLR